MACEYKPSSVSYDDYLNNFPKFSTGDYVMVFIFLSISAVIGIIITWRQRTEETVDQFLMANRRIHWFPVAISLISSFTSGISIIQKPLQVYNNGTTSLWTIICYPIAGWLSLNLFHHVFYRRRYNTVIQYLKERYNSRIAYISLGFYILTMVLYLSIVLCLPATMFDFVTTDKKDSVTFFMIASLGLCSIAYGTVGGMRSIVWIDVFQTATMFVGILAFTIQGSLKEESVFKTANLSGRLDFLNIHKIFNPTPKQGYSVMALAFGYTTTWAFLFSVTQTQVQKICTLKSMQDVRKAVICCMIGLPIIHIFLYYNGLLIYSHYKLCDPLYAKFNRSQISSYQLVPYYIMDTMSEQKGLPGLVVLSVITASISTVTSSINAVATCIYYDIALEWKPVEAKRYGPAICKLSGFFFGCILILTASIMKTSTENKALELVAMDIFGMLGGPLLALYTLGLFTKRANSLGSCIAFLVGIVFSTVFGGYSIYYSNKSPSNDMSNKTETCCYNSTYFEYYCCGSASDAVIYNNVIKPVTQWNDSRLWKISFTNGEFSPVFSVFIGFFTSFLIGYLLSFLLEHYKFVEPNLVPETPQSTILYLIPQFLRQKIPCLKDVEDHRYDKLENEPEDEGPYVYKVIHDQDGGELFIVQVNTSLDNYNMETDHSISNHSSSSHSSFPNSV